MVRNENHCMAEGKNVSDDYWVSFDVNKNHQVHVMLD